MAAVHPDGPIRTVRAIQLVLYWQSRTISRGGYSLLERLARRFPGVDLSEYIGFYALRNYDRLQGSAVTEQVSDLCFHADYSIMMYEVSNPCLKLMSHHTPCHFTCLRLAHHDPTAGVRALQDPDRGRPACHHRLR